MTAQVYFDHNASTPVSPAVLEAMLPFFSRNFGNASSRHEFGNVARKAINHAREQVAAAVGVQPVQVVFTSGGSEANNLFIKGAAAMLKPAQIAVSAVEHPCVIKPAEDLARQGWKLRKLAVDHDGRVLTQHLEAAGAEPTRIVSVMLANNETGVVLDVAGVGETARSGGAWMHTDAVQGLGKIAVDFKQLNVHAMTLSAHKIYGPKGAAALVLDKRIDLKPLIHGGGHEGGLRSGTENVAAIVGFGAACELAVGNLQNFAAKMSGLRRQLEQGLAQMGAVLFGAAAERVPNTTYFALPGIDGETLVIELDRAGFAVSSGAACSSANSGGPSQVLLAMGVEAELARGAVRVSLGAGNTDAQIAEFLSSLARLSLKLKRMAAIAV